VRQQVSVVVCLLQGGLTTALFSPPCPFTEHLHEAGELRAANARLEELAKTYDDQKVVMKQEIQKLKTTNKRLLAEQPKVYMKVKNGAKGCVSSMCTIM